MFIDFERRDVEEGAEGRKCPSCFAFRGAGRAKVPFLKCNKIPFRLISFVSYQVDMIQKRSNKLCKPATYHWKGDV